MKLLAVHLPIEVIAVIPTTEIKMAMNEYSIEVAPDELPHMAEKIPILGMIISCPECSLRREEQDERSDGKRSKDNDVLQQGEHVADHASGEEIGTRLIENCFKYNLV